MRAQRVPAVLVTLLVSVFFALLGSLAGASPAAAAAGGTPAPVSVSVYVPVPVPVSAPDAATAFRHTARPVRSDVRYRHNARHLHDGPLRTTAEEAHGARPSPLPPTPGGRLPDAASPEPATHGTVRPASARDVVRTSHRAELPDVRGPPGTADHRSRPTSPPACPS
ncbi:hypothetical protein EBF04_00895 [Streptomyces sp. I6]|nr:hypothetical protein EBF04_00895 [Streptomyces sp. I6]